VFTAGLLVGGMQNVFTDVPDESFSTKAFAWPCSSIGKTWHGSEMNSQVWPHWHVGHAPGWTHTGGLQSASVLQLRNFSTLHCPTVGPSAHSPMPVCCPATCTQSGTQVSPVGQSVSAAHEDWLTEHPKLQLFGFVKTPGRPQLLPVPHVAGGQSCPSLGPPMQRFAPQTPPAPQSASLAQGAFGVGPPAHVSHGQSNCVKPGAVHARAASLMLVPVVVGRKRMSSPLPETLAALSGGQSRDIGPKSLRPSIVHA